jgi:hypothetical protein
LTSGGTAALPSEDGKVYDINGELTGAHLFEFDLASGRIIADNRTNTGYMSQVKRQAACFSKNDPNKMYWMGYSNSGMGYDERGNWNPLPDQNWIENGKFDTSLYEVDVTTGEANRLATIDDRYMLAYMWVDGEVEVSAILRGDVNNDRNVNINDVPVLINYLLTNDDNGVNLKNADCNQKGGVTIEDVSALINYLLNERW